MMFLWNQSKWSLSDGVIKGWHYFSDHDGWGLSIEMAGMRQMGASLKGDKHPL